MQRRSAAQPNKPPMHAERFEKVHQLSTHIRLPTFSHLSLLTRKNHGAPATTSDNHPAGGGYRDCQRDGLDRNSGPGRSQHGGPELSSEFTSISVWALPHPCLFSSGHVGGALEAPSVITRSHRDPNPNSSQQSTSIGPSSTQLAPRPQVLLLTAASLLLARLCLPARQHVSSRPNLFAAHFPTPVHCLIT